MNLICCQKVNFFLPPCIFLYFLIIYIVYTLLFCEVLMKLSFSVLSGVIQGLAEFLPISSSGHLAIFQNIFGMSDGSAITAFNVLLHLGTLIAVFIVYWRDIFALIPAFFSLVGKLLRKKFRFSCYNESERLLILMVIATIPLVVIALLGWDAYLEKINGCLWAIGTILVFNGLVLLLSDRVGKQNADIGRLKPRRAFGVGLCQMCALLPGLSRSGSTITGGLLAGLNRESAVKFSFMLSIPAILGASVLELPELFDGQNAASAGQWGVYLAGAAVAAIIGVLAMKLLQYISRKATFSGFSFYCFAVGAFAIFYDLVR